MELGHGIAPELLEQHTGEDERYHGLTDNPGGRHDADITALVMGPGRFLGLEVDRGERLEQGRDWLHVSMHDERLAVAHAAGQPAGAVRLVAQTPVVVNGDVVHLRAWQPRPLHPIADRDRLAGRNADDRLGEEAIESRIPLAVAAEARRNTLGDHREDPAERVTALARRV